MKRSPELQPLSHDHHHALDVARRLKRATEADLEDVRAYRDRFWAERGAAHFDEEERMFNAGNVPAEMLDRMLREHAQIRAATVASVAEAHALGTLLHDHVRFEERELFP